MPELRTAQENARLEIGSQRGRNSHQINFLGIYDLQGLSYGRTELLVADMRLLAPDPRVAPSGGSLGPCAHCLSISPRTRRSTSARAKQIPRPGPASGPGPGGSVRVLSGFCPGALNCFLSVPGAAQRPGVALRVCPGAVSGSPLPLYLSKNRICPKCDPSLPGGGGVLVGT